MTMKLQTGSCKKCVRAEFGGEIALTRSRKELIRKVQSSWFTPCRPNYSHHGSHHVDQTTVNMVHTMWIKPQSTWLTPCDQTTVNMVHTTATKLQSTRFTTCRPNYSLHGSYHGDQSTANMFQPLRPN